MTPEKTVAVTMRQKADSKKTISPNSQEPRTKKRFDDLLRRLGKSE
jgi:hypothetical protein